MKTLIICALALISTSAIADTLQDDARQDLEQAKTAQVQGKVHMSGLDYLKAGDNASDGKAAIHFYLKAAQYGYRNRALSDIAMIYQQGIKGIAPNPRLFACYANLTAKSVDQAFIQYCHQQFAFEFTNPPINGIQSDHEASVLANKTYRQYCQDQLSTPLLNPKLDQRVSIALKALICHEHVDHESGPANGSLIIKGNTLYRLDAGTLKIYNAPIKEGATVYRHNPRWSSYVLHDGKLIPQHTGEHHGTGE